MSAANMAQLLRCVRGVEKGNSAHTLAYCLFWSQHATHELDGRPSIYKTGPEIEAALPITARTANEHLKRLARKGYWTLDYRPKPGGIVRVTWLNFSERSLELILMASSIDLGAKRKKSGNPTADGSNLVGLTETKSVAPMSENGTSIQTSPTSKTAKAKRFILTKSQGKQGMNETFSSKKIPGEGTGVKAPKWMKVDSGSEQIATTIQRAWESANLPGWDWTSQYSWQHLIEICAKLGSRGFVEVSQIERVLAEVIKHWNWLRFCMDARYQDHPTNLHRPSPLAFACECNRLLDKLEGKWSDEIKSAAKASSSNLDEGFF